MGRLTRYGCDPRGRPTVPAWRGRHWREVARDRRERRAEIPERAEEIDQYLIAAGEFPTADRAGRCDGPAPEEGTHESITFAGTHGTSEAQIRHLHANLANARPPAHPPSEATASGYLSPDDPELDPDLDRDDEPEFDPDDLGEALGVEPFFPGVRLPNDLSRYIAAMRAKSRPQPPEPRTLKPAYSPEECRRCGIPGRKGCAHQAPYEAEFVAVPWRDLNVAGRLMRGRGGC